MARVKTEQRNQESSDREVSQELPRRVTLHDVARVAGVNVSTVSDALKGTGRVAPKTRELVQRIAAEQNYVPNMAARALVTGRTGTIAVVSGPVNEYYYGNIVHLLETQLAGQGYKMMLLRTRREVQELVTATETSAVDGVIAIDRYYLVDEFLRRGNQRVRPCVFVGTFSPAFVDHVTIDLSAATEQALQTMLDANCKRIAYLVTSEIMADPSEVRTKIYLSKMKEAGQRPEIINLRTGINSVRNHFNSHLQIHGCPDGLLCQNDETAISANRALMDLGHQIPDEILLVGCDGLRHMECFEPPLSTIVQPMEEISALAWQFLQQRMSDPNGPLQQTTVPAHLVTRKSLQAPNR